METACWYIQKSYEMYKETNEPIYLHGILKTLRLIQKELGLTYEEYLDKKS